VGKGAHLRAVPTNFAARRGVVGTALDAGAQTNESSGAFAHPTSYAA